MHFLKSLSKLLLGSLLLSNLQASNNFDEEILSDTRKKTFDLNEEQIKEDSLKLKKDWINPINLQYTKYLGEDYKNEKSLISINQPIFRSGGIYQAIKYADSTYDSSSIQINQERKKLIKEAINFLYLIEKTNLNIKKTKLSVLNAQIDVNRKKEQVLNGFLDSSFLDNALLTLNDSKQSLITLKYQKIEYINNFNNISSKDYSEFELPKFEFFDEKEYIQRNIDLAKAKADIIKDENFKAITIAKYLPSVNAFYNYSKNHYTNGKPGLENSYEQDFGLTVTLPLDSRTFNDIESKKIEALKSKLSYKNKIDDEKTFYKNQVQKVNMLEERIAITKEDLGLYNSILTIIKEEKEAQLKTQSDLDTLQNSQKIKSLDLKIFEIDRQMELLELYVKLK
ncbi:TolC family protein [Poseidonibacter lekithochrous]|uniref:TolC family protein n=1 Tax=Poseidonibacter lekithochrous TaxID=1904463 RepID=UPI0008FCC068|nr:TolC family protein [Poseidonibacter lekithochrous]QKJ24275.1 RND family efflux system, outer membrane channel protein, TolC family [Poseidonibacter lekithochrous]